MSALLLLCILLVYSGKSSAMNKGEKNIPNKEVSVESDRLPIADPYVMLTIISIMPMVPVVQQQVKASPASPPMI